MVLVLIQGEHHKGFYFKYQASMCFILMEGKVTDWTHPNQSAPIPESYPGKMKASFPYDTISKLIKSFSKYEGA